jgi:hypothetical protein
VLSFLYDLKAALCSLCFLLKIRFIKISDSSKPKNESFKIAAV